MTISRINGNLSVTEKIRQLGEMIMELAGLIDQAKFSKNELDNLYTQLAVSGFNLDRKYLRNQNLGHTLGTYTGWTHLKAETGYSIWKYSPTNYSYSSLNQLYLDNILLENRGEAGAESATSFDKVFFYDATLATYTDDTTEAGTETGTEFSLMNETADFVYLGLSTTFAGAKFEFQTRGSGYDLEFEYWNGSAWTTLSYSGNAFVDDTSNFESDANVTWTIPGDWATTTVNSVASKYWVRVKTSAIPVTVAKAYYIIPANSVPALLALSSDDIIEGNWAFCTYGSDVYVTIRNSGSTAYEGDYYLTSSSSDLNKQNYFIYLHTFSADFLDSTYSGV